MRVSELPVVFLSYDEPWAGEFFDDLKAKAPGAKRVHGVKGLDACHKAAAEEAGERWFITVDADTLVDADFFEAEIPDEFLIDNCRLHWASRNGINGVRYGNGSLKCWPRQLAMDMRTHEAAPDGTTSLDHDIGSGLSAGVGPMGFQMPTVYSTTQPAGTPWHAFRCGYREGLRLCRAAKPDGRPIILSELLPEWHLHRLLTWCSVGNHAPNGIWVIYGARMGTLACHTGDWDLSALNDFDWFQRIWSNLIEPRFEGSGGQCGKTGFVWDAARLQDEVEALGDRIGRQLGLTIPDLSAETSAFMCRNADDVSTSSTVDTVGYMYQQGRGLPKDAERAAHFFRLGALLNLSASHNNLARMYHKGVGQPAEPALAERHYEIAIALDDRFAPYHLASLLAESGEPGEDLDARLEDLVGLAEERGFNPEPVRRRSA